MNESRNTSVLFPSYFSIVPLLYEVIVVRLYMIEVIVVRHSMAVFFIVQGPKPPSTPRSVAYRTKSPTRAAKNESAPPTAIRLGSFISLFFIVYILTSFFPRCLIAIRYKLLVYYFLILHRKYFDSNKVGSFSLLFLYSSL